jgi:hypothetical protein
MINTTDILSAWQRIGWNEPSDSDYVSILDADNLTSLSGLKFDALHALANFVMVKDTYPDPDVSSAVINELLKAWQQNAIIRSAKDVFVTEDRIEQGVLLKSPIDFNLTITNPSKFVGWKIVVPEGYVLTIKSVELLFDLATPFSLYVFNESQRTAITAFTKVVTPAANSVKIETLDYSLYGKSKVYKTGTYFIGYFQTANKAIQRPFYPVNSICSFRPVEAVANGLLLPDYRTNYQSGYTWGLNLDYIIRKDFTPDYLNNVDLFDKLISNLVIRNVLEQIHFSSRINLSQATSKDSLQKLSAKAFLDLNGSFADNPDIPYKRGLINEYDDVVKSVRDLIYRKTKLTVCTIK